MAKNIIWYSKADGSHGACTADELIICNADDLTPDESYALYEGSQDGNDDLTRDTMVSISERQSRRPVMINADDIDALCSALRRHPECYALIVWGKADCEAVGVDPKDVYWKAVETRGIEEGWEIITG